VEVEAEMGYIKEKGEVRGILARQGPGGIVWHLNKYFSK
jgi:hypothetical protein